MTEREHHSPTRPLSPVEDPGPREPDEPIEDPPPAGDPEPEPIIGRRCDVRRRTERA